MSMDLGFSADGPTSWTAQAWRSHHGASRMTSVAEAGGAPPPPGDGVLFLGEDNPQSADKVHALWPHPPGCAGHRLVAILGLHLVDYLSCWRMNLCSFRWSVAFARERARSLLLSNSSSDPWRTVVLLGRRVADVVSAVVGVEVPTWGWTPHRVRSGGGVVDLALASIPHPSGRSRAWNDPLADARARDLLRDLEPRVPWGDLNYPLLRGAP